MDSAILEEWNELKEDHKKLETTNQTYLKKLQELSSLQKECIAHISHQRYRMKRLASSLKKLKGRSELQDQVKKLEGEMMKREAELQHVEETLPKKGSKYLKLVLGNIDVTFLNKEEKFKYKDDYEKFKLINHVVAVVMCFLILATSSRFLELAYLAFLVWYYCTTSIRESILKVNGSRIKGWWRLHHVLSTISSAILLVWPDNEPWQSFRVQFTWFNIVNCLITYLQFKYQRGVLYRLKALGERDNMDITIEGFHTWMWKGLAFLFPCLFVLYGFELANAIVLYNLSYHEEATWQVPVLSGFFFLFFLGNSITTIMVIPNKMRQSMMFRYKVMTNRVYGAVSEKVKFSNNNN